MIFSPSLSTLQPRGAVKLVPDGRRNNVSAASGSGAGGGAGAVTWLAEATPEDAPLAGALGVGSWAEAQATSSKVMPEK